MVQCSNYSSRSKNLHQLNWPPKKVCFLTTSPFYQRKVKSLVTDLGVFCTWREDKGSGAQWVWDYSGSLIHLGQTPDFCDPCWDHLWSNVFVLAITVRELMQVRSAIYCTSWIRRHLSALISNNIVSWPTMIGHLLYVGHFPYIAPHSFLQLCEVCVYYHPHLQIRKSG